MCSHSSSSTRVSRHRRKAAKEVASPKPARKSRTKTRKPKYLSLKLELSPKTKTKTKKKTPVAHKPKNKMNNKKQQLINLFPLHPENLVQKHKDMHDHDHDQDQVAFLWETASCDDTSITLHGLLDSTTATTSEDDGPPLSCHIEINHDHDHVHQEEIRCCDHGRASLLERAAMKCKERDLSEERWVSYWELVEKKEQEDVSSSSCYGTAAAADHTLGRNRIKMLQFQDHDDKKGLVGLKLDYQEILNAWSDKGPLYIEGDQPPQTVPDITTDDHVANSNALMDGWGNLWRVPELCGMKMREGRKSWKSGQREASVLRYKEKRQSRLFAKRIRYEVRKLNAERRPRLKGRFVKRS